LAGLETVCLVQLELDFTVVPADFSTEVFTFERHTLFSHPDTLEVVETKVEVDLFFTYDWKMPLLFPAGTSFLRLGRIPGALTINNSVQTGKQLIAVFTRLHSAVRCEIRAHLSGGIIVALEVETSFIFSHSVFIRVDFSYIYVTTGFN
jgi:hypothetical protein